MKNINAEKISDYALLSMIQEVAVSPKPGLVDRFNNGRHKDMNFQTFIDSSFAIKKYFGKCFNLGYNNKNLLILRKFGIIAEKEMYKATNNVNTHKGIIFSLGFISYAIGLLEREKKEYELNDICNKVKELCSGISDELNVKNPKTYGEKLYREYGFKGIREEAEEGFIKVLEIGLPCYKNSRKSLNVNDSLIQVLLFFMTQVNDSNVLGRGGLEGLSYVKEVSQEAIDKGGMFTKTGREYIYELNDKFVEKNISPGGSADYLILTYFFNLLENGD